MINSDTVLKDCLEVVLKSVIKELERTNKIVTNGDIAILFLSKTNIV